jgi:hypothetical protein
MPKKEVRPTQVPADPGKVKDQAENGEPLPDEETVLDIDEASRRPATEAESKPPAKVPGWSKRPEEKGPGPTSGSGTNPRR